jgi:hypothetical protein
MAARTYILQGTNLTLANQAVTLAFINPGTTATLEILRVNVSQSSSTTSAQQRIQLNTQVTAFPTLVSATPAKTTTSDPSSAITGATTGAAGTCGVNASAEGAGTKTVLYPDVFNILNGWLWLPAPEERIVLPAGSASGFGVHLPAAAASLTGWNVAIVYREW